jgi:hypothetical protein
MTTHGPVNVWVGRGGGEGKKKARHLWRKRILNNKQVQRYIYAALTKQGGSAGLFLKQSQPLCLCLSQYHLEFCCLSNESALKGMPAYRSLRVDLNWLIFFVNFIIDISDPNFASELGRKICFIILFKNWSGYSPELSEAWNLFK